MRFIGDIHGDVLNYSHIIADSDESVQVGDFGFGPLWISDGDFVDPLHESGKHKFIRGNHDDPAICKERVGYIEDGTVDTERGIMYIGGAWSIDWPVRTPGSTWWADEELSIPEFVRMHELFVHHKPKVMVTHDAPESVSFDMFIAGTTKQWHKTRTAQAFEGMFQRHQPDIWIFGHWHENRDVMINGTRFICLGINSYIDLEI